MLDESIVQLFGRIRVHATKRVESKRNEAKVVPVTDLPVRLDVIVVEQLKARQGTGLSLSPVIDTKRIGRITDGHVQNVQPPALIVYILVCSACGVPCLSSTLSHDLQPLTKRQSTEAGWCATGGTLNLGACHCANDTTSMVFTAVLRACRVPVCATHRSISTRRAAVA